MIDQEIKCGNIYFELHLVELIVHIDVDIWELPKFDDLPSFLSPKLEKGKYENSERGRERKREKIIQESRSLLGTLTVPLYPFVIPSF